MLCTDSATSREGLGDTGNAVADYKAVLEASKPIIDLPRDILDNNCLVLVTALSRTLKASLFVTVVPWTMLRFPTRMIVVELQIL